MIETDRPVLRKMTHGGFDALCAVFSDVEAMRHYPVPFVRDRVRGWIEWNLENYSRYGFGLWSVVLKDTGDVIGDCGITMQSIEGRMPPEIGYHIRRNLWRRGYAREVTCAVRDWACRNTSFDALYSYMKYTNTASLRTALSAGMRMIRNTRMQSMA